MVNAKPLQEVAYIDKVLPPPISSRPGSLHSLRMQYERLVQDIVPDTHTSHNVRHNHLLKIIEARKFRPLHYQRYR